MKVHTIKIFVLYVEIVATIHVHTSDYCLAYPDMSAYI
jgi:hypothetical protein